MTSTSPYRATPRSPDVLICAGLDPSGGAGLIADTRVISQLGARPCGVAAASARSVAMSASIACSMPGT